MAARACDGPVGMGEPSASTRRTQGEEDLDDASGEPAIPPKKKPGLRGPPQMTATTRKQKNNEDMTNQPRVGKNRRLVIAISQKIAHHLFPGFTSDQSNWAPLPEIDLNILLRNNGYTSLETSMLFLPSCPLCLDSLFACWGRSLGLTFSPDRQFMHWVTGYV